jgi:hypothetical protein
MRRRFDSSSRRQSYMHPAKCLAKRPAARRRALARLVQLKMGMTRFSLTLMATLLLIATDVSAQQLTAAERSDRVLLEEVMPGLTGTPLGAVDVAQAPLPGNSLSVRRSDVQRALRQAGLASALKPGEIPKSVQISREAIALSREQLSAQADDAVRSATSPCELRDARYPSEVRVMGGPRSFRAEFNGLRSGTVTGAVYVDSGGRSTRVPVIANLTCPPPEVASGQQLLAIAVVGSVKATAPAEARQPGRVGEIIRITNRATGASLRGRVVDSRTVEIVP